MKNEHCKILTFYAISPIHAGSGSMISAIDLPIQRERHTNWPHIQASSVKGALRDHYRNYTPQKDEKLINFIFGSDYENDNLPGNPEESIPGCIAVTDAKLLAFPVRSNVAPFLWITCPLAIQRLNRDLDFTGTTKRFQLESVEKEKGIWIRHDSNCKQQNILLEDIVVSVEEEINQESLNLIVPSNINRLLLVEDEIFTYLVDTATEIQTQIKIDSDSGTTKTGSLRYQELLPSDSFLYSLVYFKDKYVPDYPKNDYPKKEKTRDGNEDKDKEELEKLYNKVKSLQMENIIQNVENAINGFLQVGGDYTLGRGLCAIKWITLSK